MAIFRSYNFVLGGDMLAKGLSAVALLAAMRFLTPAEFGDYVFVSAMALAAYAFFNGFFNRRIVFNQIAKEALRATQVVALMLTGCAYLVVVSFALFTSPGIGLAGLALAGAAIVFDVRRSILQRAQSFRRYTVVEVLRAGFFLAATTVVLTLLDGGRALWLLLSLALSYALAAVAIGSAASRDSRVTWRRLAESAGALLTRDSLLLLAFFILFGLAAHLPALLYRPLASASDYAELGVAFRYYGLLVSITSAFHVVTMPAIANVSADESAALVRRVLLLALFALFLVLGAVIAGYLIIPIVDGGKYPDAPALFAAMSVGLVFGVYCGVIISANLREGRYFPLLAGQIASVAITAAIIWRFGAARPMAVAIALPVGIAAQLAVLVICNRREGLVGALSRPPAP
jgi:O-antigen/teichoic acid export membrane protein